MSASTAGGTVSRMGETHAFAPAAMTPIRDRCGGALGSATGWLRRLCVVVALLPVLADTACAEEARRVVGGSSDLRMFGDLMLGASEGACAAIYDPTVQIEHILQILPDTTDIVVATGTSPTERFWIDTFRPSFERFSSRVTFHWFTDLSADEMVKRAVALPPRSAIYYPAIRVDVRGATPEGDVLLFNFIEFGRAPVFTLVDSHFGRGIVGGPMLSSREIAQRCAEVALRILGGEAAADIRPQPLAVGGPSYDWRQLQRWNVDETLLPRGSTIEFYEPGLWEQYRALVAGILVVIVIQAALISWLVYEHRRRTFAEVQSRNSMAELARINRVTTAGELSASIAHEIGQPVSGMVLRASAALHWLGVEKPDLEKVRDALTDIVGAGKHAGEVIKSLRAMFKKDTRTPKVRIDINGVINTVLAIVRVDLQSAKIRIETELDETLPAVEGNPVQLQQVILNLVMNAMDAMRTTQPRILRIQSRQSGPGTIQVSVEDSGTGIIESDRARVFDALFTTKASGMGMGLSICRSIVESHGGKIWVMPGAERGSIFRFELPADARARSRAELAAQADMSATVIVGSMAKRPIV